MYYVWMGLEGCYRAFIIAVPIYLITLLVLMMAGRKKMLKRKLYLFREFLFVIYLLMVLSVAGLLTGSWHFDMNNLNFNTALFSGSSYDHMALNILMFVPMGVFVPWLFIRGRKKFMWTVFTGFLASLLIELLQMFFVGRVADINDLLLNTEGTIVGFVIFQAAAGFYAHVDDTCYPAVIFAVLSIILQLSFRGQNVGVYVLERLSLSGAADLCQQYMGYAVLGFAVLSLIISIYSKVRNRKKRPGILIASIAVVMTVVNMYIA